MPKAKANGVELEYETFGAPHDPAILLINGLGSQMTRWPKAFCEMLAAAGHHVIRFDNRDVGHSTWFKEGDHYRLEDMAADAVGLLDALKVKAAHVAGMSMGGMIGQVVAADHPDRTLSFTSIMSSSGAPELPPATPKAMAVLTTPAPDPKADPEAFVAHAVKNAQTIGSPGYPWPDGALAERAKAEAERAFHPAGTARQMRAVGATGDRSERLKTIKAPTVVLHGADDPLVPVAAGRDTAAKIPGSELRVVPGMGHDLPPTLYETFAQAIFAAVARLA